MIVNPACPEGRLRTFPGTRVLVETFGLLGLELWDPVIPTHKWTVSRLYRPVGKLDGIRAKVVDQKGFVSFINQMDLEVLLGFGIPGSICRWSEREYQEPGALGWNGAYMDDIDLCDDLLDREADLLNLVGSIDVGGSITRRIHKDTNINYEEDLLVVKNDGQYGVRFVEAHWCSMEKRRVRWDFIT